MWHITDCTSKKNADSHFEGIWFHPPHVVIISAEWDSFMCVEYFPNCIAHYHVDSSALLDPVHIRMKAVSVLTRYFFTLHFNIILSAKFWSSAWSIPSRFPCQYFCAFLASLTNLTWVVSLPWETHFLHMERKCKTIIVCILNTTFSYRRQGDLWRNGSSTLQIQYALYLSCNLLQCVYLSI